MESKGRGHGIQRRRRTGMATNEKQQRASYYVAYLTVCTCVIHVLHAHPHTKIPPAVTRASTGRGKKNEVSPVCSLCEGIQKKRGLHNAERRNFHAFLLLWYYRQVLSYGRAQRTASTQHTGKGGTLAPTQKGHHFTSLCFSKYTGSGVMPLKATTSSIPFASMSSQGTLRYMSTWRSPWTQHGAFW
jgi:hypothetical protein